MTTTWQLATDGPAAYERNLVPKFFAPCAELLLDLAEVVGGERFLDVGCGTGIVARKAAGRGAKAAGVEPNEGMLAVARQAAPEIAWHAAWADALPRPDSSYGVVCCQQALQFVPDRPAALLEMYRVLVPGGRVALAVWRRPEQNPAFLSLIDSLERVAGAEAAGIMRRPFSGPGAEDLRALMAGAGFEDVSLRIGIIAVRFASTFEFLRAQVESSPLAGPIGALDRDRTDALIREVDTALESYVDDDGVVYPLQTWLVTARKPI
ncbi:class I SAM-dependent methyltransferase [Kribbella sp. NPDC049174]|uniref:class I SAM-dependent methyltransferase n=1 Tax=Kribbella sp. NPDC049174 TaxID=3364112 RepID=UPI00371A7F23